MQIYANGSTTLDFTPRSNNMQRNATLDVAVNAVKGPKMKHNFSHMIYFLRKVGMTDAEIARASGTTSGIVSRIVKGLIPRYDVALALIALYDERRARLTELLGCDPTEASHE